MVLFYADVAIRIFVANHIDIAIAIDISIRIFTADIGFHLITIVSLR